jgi:hypothetical protein
MVKINVPRNEQQGIAQALYLALACSVSKKIKLDGAAGGLLSHAVTVRLKRLLLRGRAVFRDSQ